MIKLRDNRFGDYSRKFSRHGQKLEFQAEEEKKGKKGFSTYTLEKNADHVLSLLKNYSGDTLSKLREKSQGNLITLGRVKKESEEDPAFFTLCGKDNNYCLETSNLMGVLRLRDPENGTSVQIEVHSRFDEDNSQSFLNYLLSKVFRVDFIGSAAKGSVQLWDILAAILFIQKLKEAVPVGLYKEYKRFEENDLKFRGRLDLARHLRQNYPLQDKIAYSYRAITFDNPLNHLLRSAVDVIQRKYPELLYSDNEIKNFVSALKNATPSWSSSNTRDLLRSSICRESLRHPFFAPYYEEPRRLAKMLLEEEGYSIYDTASEDEVSGVIFDGAWLWEEYIATILTPLGFVHADPDNKTGGLDLKIGELQNVYPDFYNKDKKIVLDTKYKRDTEKREDIYQVLSYALITGSPHCGLIFPPEEVKKEEDNNLKLRTINVTNGYVSPAGAAGAVESTETPASIQWHSIAFPQLQGDIVKFMQGQEESLKTVIENMTKNPYCPWCGKEL